MKKNESYIIHRVLEILSFNLSKAPESEWNRLTSIIIKLSDGAIQETSRNMYISILFDYLFIKYHQKCLDICELKSALAAIDATYIIEAFPADLPSIPIHNDQYLSHYISNVLGEVNA